jgi:tRNA-specific 2-thiouridylase
VLGRHAGIINFTVGQRRGLGIAAGEPLYVVRLDAAKRRVVVGPRPALRTTRVHLRDLNWIGDGALDGEMKPGERLDVFVKVRSSRPPQPAWLANGEDGFEVEFVGGEEGVAPGQACVLYDAAAGQARMLGGGFIRSAVSQGEVEGLPALGVPTAPLVAR